MPDKEWLLTEEEAAKIVVNEAAKGHKADERAVLNLVLDGGIAAQCKLVKWQSGDCTEHQELRRDALSKRYRYLIAARRDCPDCMVQLRRDVGLQ